MGYTLLIYGLALVSIVLMIWSDSIEEDVQAKKIMDITGYIFGSWFVLLAIIQVTTHYLRVVS